MTVSFGRAASKSFWSYPLALQRRRALSSAAAAACCFGGIHSRAASTLAGVPLVSGVASGRLLYADVGLSFWGGVCADSGNVIDTHHPLCGEAVSGAVLAIPNGRGSCTGSQVLLELLLEGRAPAAILLRQPDDILALGSIVGDELFGCSVPMVSLGDQGFAEAGRSAHVHASIGEDGTVRLLTADDLVEAEEAEGARVRQGRGPGTAAASSSSSSSSFSAPPPLLLSAADEAMLRGEQGRAAQVAMSILRRVALLQGAPDLIDISSAHIDACIHTGPASLRFANRFVEWSGQVRVPTTLNAISVDLDGWRAQGVSEAEGAPASALAEAYLALGCKPSFTCAPYLTDQAPAADDHVGWSESNAVVYANSVLGARTQKYADYLDLCVALTGRAPRAGVHLDAGRQPTLVIDVHTDGLDLAQLDDAFFGALGYLVGLESSASVPLVRGLHRAQLPPQGRGVALKAFSAAFGTTSSSPLFHMAGHTPEAVPAELAVREAAEAALMAPIEAAVNEPERRVLSAADLARAYDELGGRCEPTAVQLIALGTPHFSADECAALRDLLEPLVCNGLRLAGGTRLVVTLGREVRREAERNGAVRVIEQFGGELVSDTCWCMVREPIVPTDPNATILTNSAKYAHYAPALVGRRVRFASLEGCVQAAVSGRTDDRSPAWLLEPGGGSPS